MINIITPSDDYSRYEKIVNDYGYPLEDWDYIIVDENKKDINTYEEIDIIADKLSCFENKLYKDEEKGMYFYVVYHS